MAPFSFLSKFRKKPTLSQENFLSLILTNNNVTAIIWAEKNSEVNIEGTATKPFTQISSLVHETAIAIDKAAEKVTADVTKVVFGLSDSWLENGQLSPTTSKTLDALTKDLELEAQAFIPLSAAVLHHFKHNGKQLTGALLVGIFDNYSEIHRVKEGKTEKSKNFNGKITTDELDEEMEGENQLKEIVFFGSGFEHLAQKVKKKSPDKYDLEEVSENEMSMAVALSQAADVLGYEPQIAKDHPKHAENPAEKEEKVSKEDLLGFIEGRDVLLMEDDKEEKETADSHTPQEEIKLPVKPDKKEEQYAVSQEITENTEGAPRTPTASILTRLTTLAWLPNFPDIIKGGSKKILILLGIVVAILIASFYFLAPNLTKAVAEIQVAGDSFEKDFEAEGFVGAEDGGNLSLAQVAAAAQKTEKAAATGTRKIGNYASGTVKVFNWTTNPVTFDSDTNLITKDGIKFKLDAPIEVASRSAANPGQQDAKAKAIEFGENGNIPAGKDFTFQSFDELLYSGRNDEPFSGGDEKEITVVAQNDLTKLEKSLTESLTKEAKEKLSSENPGKKFDESQITVKVIKKSFDKKLDEEANAVNLSMEVEASAVVYEEENLKNLLAEKYSQDAPQGLEIKAASVEISDIESKRSKDKVTFSGHFKSPLSPKVDDKELAKQVAGKSQKEAREIIKKLPNVSEVNFTFTPSLPLIGTLPKNPEKITFKFKS
ncbi:baseplate J/gp47 family protein [Candidatus Curtissbacteria bacterium]|nr:baseplate J/gp47 family protein [Candidatus Curtissbacteria bacterium]